jgi:acetyl esterase/lipase
VEYSALHTIEELQAFTSQWVPVPHWVKSDEIEIPTATIRAAAEHLQKELGPEGIEQVGGKQWWQWRRDNAPLKAEWIEMRKDYHDRKAARDKGRRVILYVHGGAYYFGSVDEHRYQMQRHARKLKARCLAPRYRLAPQFPFPCGLLDCLAAYLYLLNEYDPTCIVVAGDSAGGGMVLSLLVLLRDQGIPLPAGGILLSPWVDLMHSFPSLSGDGKLDYIPSNGFIHKPSMGWPPPTLEAVEENTMPSGVAAAIPIPDEPESNGAIDPAGTEEPVDEKEAKNAEQGFSVEPISDTPLEEKAGSKLVPEIMYRDNMTGRIEHSTHLPSVEIDGEIVQIRDQIQMYAPNHLLTHPLVSPALQPSLGGLPPLLIQAGGGELLRDEQIYIAHKAAHPSKYPPSKATLDKYDPDRKILHKYRPTDVQLQVWEDLCHVGHTLSWTRPAKYMYRSVAQFGAWALARAQKRPIDIDYDSSDSESDSESLSDESAEKEQVPEEAASRTKRFENTNTLPLPNFAPLSAATNVGKAGDPLPPFKYHMIRQRVDRHGNVHPLSSESELPALQLSPDEIGVLKEGPVRKWLARQEKWNKKFASQKKGLQKKRRAQLAKGYVGIPEGEKPPPMALAGRRTKDLPRLARVKRSWGMSMWSGWGSKHDQLRVSLCPLQAPSSHTQLITLSKIKRDVIAEELDEIATQPHLSPSGEREGKHKRTRSGTQSHKRGRSGTNSRSSRSRRPSIRNVVDEGQAAEENARPRSAPHADGEKFEAVGRTRSFSAHDIYVANTEARMRPGNGTLKGEGEDLERVETIIPPSQSGTTRPTHDGIAYPFKLKMPETEDSERNPSIMTLHSDGVDEEDNDGLDGILTDDKKDDGEKGLVERPPIERFVTAREEL